MTAPLVYVTPRTLPMTANDLEGEYTGNVIALVRGIYRRSNADDGTLGGTLWEREAERATLTK